MRMKMGYTIKDHSYLSKTEFAQFILNESPPQNLLLLFRSFHLKSMYNEKPPCQWKELKGRKHWVQNLGCCILHIALWFKVQSVGRPRKVLVFERHLVAWRRFMNNNDPPTTTIHQEPWSTNHNDPPTITNQPTTTIHQEQRPTNNNGPLTTTIIKTYPCPKKVSVRECRLNIQQQRSTNINAMIHQQ